MVVSTFVLTGVTDTDWLKLSSFSSETWKCSGAVTTMFPVRSIPLSSYDCEAVGSRTSVQPKSRLASGSSITGSINSSAPISGKSGFRVSPSKSAEMPTAGSATAFTAAVFVCRSAVAISVNVTSSLIEFPSWPEIRGSTVTSPVPS